MGVKVSVERMADEIMEGLKEYADLAADDMKDAVRKVSKSVKKDIEENAPKRTGAYAKSWGIKTMKETPNSLELSVHSKKHYRLTHLLEHGHALRQGGRAKAIPHIAPAEQRGTDELVKEIEKALKG